MSHFPLSIVLLAAAVSCSAADRSQPPPQLAPGLPARLTLRAAEAYALAHQPALAASALRAQAEALRIVEARSQFFPQIQLDAVAVKARDDDSRIAANTGISNPTILTRQSDGAIISQLITDFGRTADLTASARSASQSAAQRFESNRQALLLRVDRAYFAAQGAQALLSVAAQSVTTNQLLLDRVQALTSSRLKSSLDVSFQQVGLAQARFLQLQAQARLQEALDELADALGLTAGVSFDLVPEPLAPPPPPAAGPLIAEAWNHRPDLLAARAAFDSAMQFAGAERAAHFPVITAQGGFGINPESIHNTLPHDYGAAGLNASLPLFTGGLLTARADEAALRARAAGLDAAALETDIAREVYDAWVEANTAYQGIAVSRQLVESARQAFELARSRYQVGTSSIVELSQADLLEIQAEITAASSEFDFAIRSRILDFEVGRLH